MLALKEASDIVMKNPRLAVTDYLEDVKSKMTIDEVTEIIADPRFSYEVTPRKTKFYADFMHRVGKTKRTPASWKDMYFPEIHDLNGG